MSLHTEAGYTEAILSLSLNAQSLANREETIYGLRARASLSLARSEGYEVAEVEVSYEFQRGGNQMLRIRKVD